MMKTQFKRCIALAIMIALLMPVLPASMETFPFVAYTNEMTSLRQDAFETSESLVALPAGSGVSVSGEEGAYYIAIYEGRTGYLLKNRLSQNNTNLSPQPTPRAASEKAQQNYPMLTSGDNSEHVSSLQMGLIELGFLKGVADGKYGPATADAVKAFQKRNSLPENGIADPLTQQRLFEGRPYNAKGKRITVKTVSSSSSDITLRSGDRGLPVEKMQSRLKELGYYTSKVDGIYGRGTRTAVVAFQKANKLKADGIAGSKTLNLLYGTSALAKGGTATLQETLEETPAPGLSSPQFAETAEATYPYTTTVLDSVNLRKRANTRAMRITTVPRGANINVLKVSGDFLQVEYKTYKGYVLSEYVNIPDQYLPGKAFESDTAARVRYETLTIGASGAKVKALQEGLQELGFYIGKPDASFGTATQQAVRKFQTQNGYKATGIALPEMQKLLYEDKPRNSSNRKVYVDTLPPVENPDMQQGDKGDAVATLQQTLTTLGFYKGTVDGVYNKATVNAVKAYQKAHSIRETGKMNNFTWLSINAATKPASTENTVTDNYLTEENVIVMRRGTRGVAVTRLQERLVALGYYTKVPNGVYEAADVEAVRTFQRNNGFTSSGVADLFTQRALYSANAIPGSETPPEGWQSLTKSTPAVTTTPAPTYETLKIGSSGGAVQALQTRLITLNYLTGKADGLYGTQTAQAVTSFQKANKLAADGIAGQATLSAIYATTASVNAMNTPAVTETGSLTRALKVGDRGSDVAEVQRKLIAMKYLNGGADGIFGPATALALQAFQQRNNLKADGIAGSLTWAKLNSAQAIASGEAVVSPLKPITPTVEVETATFSAPRASEVRFAHWYSEVKSRMQRMPNITIYDFITGKHYNVKVFSNGAHADGEPVTAEDTATMESALGVSNWTARPVWVIFSDGRVYMGSTHSRGHEVDKNPHNNLQGHICVHFPRDMADAEATGPYAVSHQNAILAGWDLTQQMAK